MLKKQSKYEVIKKLPNWMLAQIIGRNKHFDNLQEAKGFVKKYLEIVMKIGTKNECRIKLSYTGKLYFGYPLSYDKELYSQKSELNLARMMLVANTIHGFLLERVQVAYNEGAKQYSIIGKETAEIPEQLLVHPVDVSQFPASMIPPISTPQTVSDLSEPLLQTQDLLDPEVLDYIDNFDYSTNAENQDSWQKLLLEGSPVPPVHDDNFMSMFNDNEYAEFLAKEGVTIEGLSMHIGLTFETINAVSQKDVNHTFPTVVKTQVPDLDDKDLLKKIPEMVVPEGQTVGTDMSFQERNESKTDAITKASASVYESILSVCEYFRPKFTKKYSLGQFMADYRVFRQTPGIKFYLPVFFYVFKKVELWATEKLQTKGARLIWAPAIFEWIIGMLLCKMNHLSSKCQFWKGYSHGVTMKGGGFELLLNHLARYTNDQEFDTSVKSLLKDNMPLVLPEELFDEWVESALLRRAGNDSDFKQWDFNQFGIVVHGFFRYIMYSFEINFEDLRMKDVIFMSLLTLLEEYNVSKKINLNGLIVAVHRMIASGVLNTAHMGSFSNGWCQRSFYTCWYFAIRELVHAIRQTENLDTFYYAKLDYACDLINLDHKMEMFFPKKGVSDPFHEIKTSIITALKEMAYVHFSDDYLKVCDWLAIPAVELVDKARFMSYVWAHALYPNTNINDKFKLYETFHSRAIDQICELMPVHFKDFFFLDRNDPEQKEIKNNGPHKTCLTGNINYRLSTYRPLLTKYNYSEKENNLDYPDQLVGNWSLLNEKVKGMIENKVGNILSMGVNFLRNYFVEHPTVRDIIPVRGGLDMLPRIYFPTHSTEIDLDVYHLRRVGQLVYNCGGHPYMYALIRSVSQLQFISIVGMGKNLSLLDDKLERNTKEYKKLENKIGEIDFLPSEMTYQKLIKFFCKQDEVAFKKNKKFVYRPNSRKLEFRTAVIPVR